MSGSDLLALLPILVIGAAVVVVVLAVAFASGHRTATVLTVIGLAAGLLSLPFAAAYSPRQVTPLLVIDHYALFYMGLTFAASIVVALLAHGYFEGREAHRGALYHGEFYILLLLATLGAAVLVASSHFASFLLGLELLSVSLFAMIGFPVGAQRPLEGAIKYLILSGVSSAFLLFGMALIYARLGTMQFAAMGPLLAAHSISGDLFLLTGLAMIVTGIGFKLSVVPYHMWVPDVYQGAPAPVAGFVATVSKGAMFALLLRYFMTAGGNHYASMMLGFGVIAIASMIIGNLLALLQNNVKRILAYSSIAHLGYLLIAFVAGGALAAEAVDYYLVAYFITMLGAFGVVTVLSSSDGGGEVESLDEYQGLFWRRPWLAAVLTLMLLSLAGVPLTAGFFGKFYVLVAGVDRTLWPLIAALLIGSAIGLYYYLRVVVVMYKPAPNGETAAVAPALSASAMLAVLTFLLIWLGVYPEVLIHLIQASPMG